MTQAADPIPPSRRTITPAGERPELLTLCGTAGIVGALALVALMVVAHAMMPDHSPVADTISALGRGPQGWVMDIGFYLQAAGLVALAIGAAHAHLGGWGWSLGVLCLALLALVLSMIGLFDFFHPGSVPAEDLSVHTWLTYAMLPLYVAGPLATAAGAAGVRPVLGPVFRVAGIVTLVLGPVFFLSPDGIDGLVERILLVPSLVWSLSLSGIFLARASALRARA